MTATSPKGDPIVIGVVKDLEDPKKLGRVRVAYPHLKNQRSAWARLATLMAGPGRGSLFRPEPEDEVLVALLHGDPSQPYVVGALWNEDDKPPENGGTKENHLRVLRSRSGLMVRMNDKQGERSLVLIDKDSETRVALFPDQQLIVVESKSGKVQVKTGTDVEVEAGGSMKFKAKGSISLKATGEVKIEGSKILLN